MVFYSFADGAVGGRYYDCHPIASMFHEQTILPLALRPRRKLIIQRLCPGRQSAGRDDDRSDRHRRNPTQYSSHTHSPRGPAHQPSSWYSSASVPSKLPTTAGNQAAMAGPISPFAPRSSMSSVAT